jgi:glycerophosphoryl diester phosphodiesterase
MLRDADFLVVHDLNLEHSTTGTGWVRDTPRVQADQLRLLWRGGSSSQHPPLLSEVVALIAALSAPTRVELDLKVIEPLPWPRVEELARMAQPVKEHVLFNCQADWNLRRLLRVDPTLPVGFDPALYLDWVPHGTESDEGIALPRAAYGYLDRHPLAVRQLTSVADYLSDRLGGILGLVPGAREAHVRLYAFERMLDDGVAEAAELFHRQGLLLDVWTLDAGTPAWRERLARAVSAGVDIVTTNTPHALAAAGRAASAASRQL